VNAPPTRTTKQSCAEDFVSAKQRHCVVATSKMQNQVSMKCLGQKAQWQWEPIVMSGRGRGGGTGRGRPSQPNRNQMQQKTESKKTPQDCTHHIGLAKQASDCNTVTKHSISHIHKTHVNCGGDIANTLGAGKNTNVGDWKPTLSMSNFDPAEENELHEAKTEEFKILCKAEVDSWIRCKDTHRSNIGR